MSKKKFNIYNIDINNNDLYMMKEFIDLYDDCQEKTKEYNELIDEFRKDEKLSEKMNDGIGINKSLEKLQTNIINKISTSKDPKELEALKEEYKKYNEMEKQLCKYDEITTIFNNMYASNLSEYFDKENNDKQIEKNTKQEYSDYTEEELEEQIKIEKLKNKKQQTCTITQIYLNIKYLYEICSKIYETKKSKPKKMGLISMIKNTVQKLRLKKTINEINEEYVKDNEMHLARIKSDETIFIDMQSLEQNIKFYKTFKEPINKYINAKANEINNARIKSEIDPEEIKISDKITVITRKDQIEKLKQAKEELTQTKEIEVPIKTA